MYLKQTFKGYHDFWRYIIIFGVVIILNVLASVPTLIVIMTETIKSGITGESASASMDLTQYGFTQNESLLIILGPFILVFLGVAWAIKYFHGFSWTQVFTAYKKFRWGNFLGAAIIWFVLLAMADYISYLIEPENYTFHFQGRQFINLMIISIICFPFQASWEELYFRGNLMQATAAASRSRYIPILVSGILFGAVHIMNPEVKEFGIANAMVQYMGFGILLAILVVMDGGLEMAFGVHIINNIYAASLVSYQGSVISSPSLISTKTSNPELMVIAFLIAAVAFLAILKYLFQWKSFRWIFEPIQKERPLVENDSIDQGLSSN